MTTAELALASVGAGGVFGGLGTWLGVVATRNKDHEQKKWERTTDLYERVLVEATTWAATRDTLMRNYRLSGPDREIPNLDDAERHRMAIQLEMFGHREVQDAFDRYTDAHWKWAGCHQVLQNAYEQNQQVTSGLMPEHQFISTDELARRREERKTANQVADEQETELRLVIQGTARRVPKRDRWFRRAPRVIERRVRSTRRYLEATPAERHRRRQLRDL